MIRRRITLSAAVLVTAVGLAMSAAGAIDRAGSTTDRALSVAVGCCLVLGAHLLLALTRSAGARLLWVGMMLAVTYGHASWLISSAHRAGADRAAAVQTDTRTSALRDQLAQIAARPVATVAADVAAAAARAAAADSGSASCAARPGATPRSCSTAKATASAARERLGALRIELAEAERAAALRAQLADAAGQHDARQAEASTDPVAAVLANLTGLTAETVLLAVSLLSSVLIELLAAVLWSSALRQDDHAATYTHTHHHPQTTTPEIAPMASRRLRQRQGAKPWRDPQAAPQQQSHDTAEQSLLERLAEIGRQLAARPPDELGDGQGKRRQATGAAA